MSSKPHILLTIGLPVFNGEPLLRVVLESLINQSYKKFHLIISDNASTDNTAQICNEYLDKFYSVEYIRQESNIGLTRNFKYVLSKSESKYFMWSAADDLRSSDFIEVNLRNLESNELIAGSTSPSRYDYEKLVDSSRQISLIGSKENKFLNFFNHAWQSNGLTFCIFKAKWLKDAILNQAEFLGGDWALILKMSLVGDLINCNKGLIIIGTNGISNSCHIFNIFKSSKIELIVPFYRLSIYTIKSIKDFELSIKLKIYMKLLEINIRWLKLKILSKYN